ncbi:MAG: hypothetical protein R8G01_06705 [Ilumatobacteraceae bacterium]|nr:hypothetical protein [Ilumatobacteraceae bacterium]
MNIGSIIVIVAACVATVACVAWFLLVRRHPERTASHDDTSSTTPSDELYGGVDRPAGPDAETMRPGDLGGDQRSPRSS